MITAIRLPTTGAKNKTSNNGRLKKRKRTRPHRRRSSREQNTLLQGISISMT